MSRAFFIISFTDRKLKKAFNLKFYSIIQQRPLLLLTKDISITLERSYTATWKVATNLDCRSPLLALIRLYIVWMWNVQYSPLDLKPRVQWWNMMKKNVVWKVNIHFALHKAIQTVFWFSGSIMANFQIPTNTPSHKTCTWSQTEGFNWIHAACNTDLTSQLTTLLISNRQIQHQTVGKIHCSLGGLYVPTLRALSSIRHIQLLGINARKLWRKM